MVTRFGMSKAIGPMSLQDRYETLSSETKATIELEVQRLLSSSYEQVRSVLTARRIELDRLATALVKYETLDRLEVDKVIRGEQLDRPSVPSGMTTTIAVPVPALDGDTTAPTPVTPGGIITTPK